MLKYIFMITLLSFSLGTMAQEMDDEVGFIYVKAEYLMETGRYSDASKQYGEVIRLQPDYKDALLKRAMAKFEMASFRGVKDDILKAIKLTGISPDAIRMLGIADYKLGNHNAAINSLTTAIMMGSKDADVYHARGESHLAMEMFEEACSDWTTAAKRGNNKASLQKNKYCGDVVSRPRGGTKPTPNRDTGKVEKPKRDGNVFKPKPGRDTDQNDNRQEEADEVYEEEYVEEDKGPPVDNSVNKIEVDEDLSLEIKNGLGAREVLQQPNILILSDSSGDVAIDICINERGRVETAEFNASDSSLDTRSIVSLAVRKAQEFWFEKSDYEEMCGTIVFKIGGR